MDKIGHLSSLMTFAHREPLLYLDLLEISRDIEFLYRMSRDILFAKELVSKVGSIPLTKIQTTLIWIRTNPPENIEANQYYSNYIIAVTPHLGKKQFRINMNSEGYIQRDDIWIKMREINQPCAHF